MKERIDSSRIPAHVAIIMDGNGRWANQQGKDRVFGHQEGVVTVRNIVEASGELGIKYLTLYTFSTENWNRPQQEVNALMGIVVDAVKRETDDLVKKNVRLLTIGDISRLPEATLNSLKECMQKTSACTGLHLVLALSYSSRWEIIEAAKQLAGKIKTGEMSEADITEQVISDHLTTRGIPDPDLLIRTGGERRISNFLMWQLSYSELYFTDTYWPDFKANNLYEAIIDYQNRERRFGLTGAQVKSENKSKP